MAKQAAPTHPRGSYVDISGRLRILYTNIMGYGQGKRFLLAWGGSTTDILQGAIVRIFRPSYTDILYGYFTLQAGRAAPTHPGGS